LRAGEPGGVEEELTARIEQSRGRFVSGGAHKKGRLIWKK